MSVIACSEEGIEALRRMITAINEGVEEIKSATESISAFADGCGDTLGPHQASLKNSLEVIRSAINQATVPATEVGEKLTDVARKYQDIIADDPFGGFGGAIATFTVLGAGAEMASGSSTHNNGSLSKGGDSSGSGIGQSGINQILNTPAGTGVSSTTGDNSIAGVSCGAPMTIQEADTGHVNPDYDAGNNGNSINCQSCVVVYEARLRGYDVSVLPNTPGSMLEKLSYDPSQAWVDPTTGKKPEYIYNNEALNAESYTDFLENTIKQGERYTIQFFWDDEDGGGHIVNLDRDENGQLRIMDNQRGTWERSQWVGSDQVKDYLSDVKYENKGKFWNTPCVPKVLRIDNLEFNKDVVNHIMRSAK